jgi:hypothetical protein
MEKSPHLSQRAVPPLGLLVPLDVEPLAPMVLQAPQELKAHQEASEQEVP